MLWQSTEKYAYYVMGLAGTVIALAIHFTVKSDWDYHLLLVAGTISIEGLSIFIGLLSVKNSNDALMTIVDKSSALLQASIDGKLDSEDVKKKEAAYIDKYKGLNERTLQLEYWQRLTFGVGVVPFIIWHGISIYLRSLTNS